jgi:signal recognition particle receptor subunit beta
MLDKMSEERNALCEVLEQVADFQQGRKQEALARGVRSSVGSFRSHRFRVGILGSMKRGKSTLVNALLSRPDDSIAPVSVIPATGVITEFEGAGSGSGLSATVFKRSSPDTSESIDISEVRDYATEERNTNNHKDVDRIVVRGDFPLLGSSATLVDTPGNGSIFADHSRGARDALNLCDVYVLLVSATVPIDRVEQEFLQTISDQQRRQFVVALTKCDELDVADKPAVLSRIREECRKVGLQPLNIMEVSAKRALKASGAQDEMVVRKGTGLLALVGEMERIIRSESIHVSSLKARMLDAVSHAHDYLSRETDAAKRDLALAERSVEDVQAKREELEAQSKSAQEALEESAQRFRRKWNSIMGRFGSSVQSCASTVEATLHDWLDQQRGPFGTARAFSALKLQASRALANELRKEFQGLQREVDEAFEKFRVDAEATIKSTLPRERSPQDRMDTLLESLGPVVAVTGTGVVVATAMAEYVAVRTAYEALGSANANLDAAGAALSGAKELGDQGILSNLWRWTWGGGAASDARKAAQTSVTEAKTELAVATAGAWSSLITGVLVSGGSIATAIVATKIAEAYVRSKARDKIGVLVQQRCDEMVREMVGEDGKSGELGQIRDRVVEELGTRIEAQRRTQLERLEDVEKRVRAKDPQLASSIAAQITELERLREALYEVSRRLGWRG